MHSYVVSLRISGKTLNAAEVTKDLGIEPTQVRAAGQPRPGGKSVWDESMWGYEARPTTQENEWKSLEEGLQTILGTFSRSIEKLRGYQQRYKVQLFCGHFSSDFNGGPKLSPSLLKSLGEFGVELFLDTYSSRES